MYNNARLLIFVSMATLSVLCNICDMCIPQGYVYKATECLFSMTKMPTRMGRTSCYTYVAYLVWLGSTVALHLFQQWCLSNGVLVCPTLWHHN